MTPLTFRPFTSVSGRRCKVCVCVCVCIRKRKEEMKKGSERSKKRERDRKIERRAVYMGVLYVWREGSLVEEVASHKSQLMSITLIRSPIHQSTQGPIHPRFLRTCGPQEPWANSQPHSEVCHSLKTPHTDVRWAPRCIHSNVRAPTPTHTHIKPESRNRLFFLIWLIINRPLELIYFPYKHLSIASTSKRSFRMSNTKHRTKCHFHFCLPRSALA